MVNSYCGCAERNQGKLLLAHTIRPTGRATAAGWQETHRSAPYQVRDDIVALLLEPHQDAGRVQSAAVGQNHCTFRHDDVRSEASKQRKDNTDERAQSRQSVRFQCITQASSVITNP